MVRKNSIARGDSNALFRLKICLDEWVVSTALTTSSMFLCGFLNAGALTPYVDVIDYISPKSSDLGACTLH